MGERPNKSNDTEQQKATVTHLLRGVEGFSQARDGVGLVPDLLHRELNLLLRARCFRLGRVVLRALRVEHALAGV